MKLVVKICGLSTEETIDAAIDAGADMVGLVFFPPSPRYVTLDRAARLAAHARGRAEIVALAVDLTDHGLAGIVDVVKPDILQLHGKETPERVAAVKRRFARRVIKAIGMRQPGDVDVALSYRGFADALLLDAKAPDDATRPGGNGLSFDWSMLDDFSPGMDWFLSGGLSPGNVGMALRMTQAGGIDVSSGVETAPGRKDPELIRAFVTAARRVSPRQPEKVA